jgi:glycosyltransferase 2 family protein
VKALLGKTLAIALLLVLLWYVEPQQLVKILLELDLLQVALLFGISFLLIFVSCFKWRLFLRATGIEPSMRELFRLYVVGYFVNLFSPSTVGGDSMRSYAIGKKHGSQVGAFSATFFERFTGILAMVTLAVLFLIIGTSTVREFSIPIIIFTAAVTPVALAVFTDWGFSLFDKLARLIISPIGGTKFAFRIEKVLVKLEAALSYARGNRRLFLKSLLVSFVFHGLAIVNTKLAANAVGWWSASVAELFVVVPLVLIVGAIPISPSGLGLQEGAFIFFLQRIGASAPEAAGVAVLLRAKTLVLGAVGGVLLLISRGRK